EVRDAEPLVGLVARAVAKPHAERDRAAVGHGFAEDGEPRRQHGAAIARRGDHRSPRAGGWTWKSKLMVRLRRPGEKRRSRLGTSSSQARTMPLRTTRGRLP